MPAHVITERMNYCVFCHLFCINALVLWLGELTIFLNCLMRFAEIVRTLKLPGIESFYTLKQPPFFLLIFLHYVCHMYGISIRLQVTNSTIIYIIVLFLSNSMYWSELFVWSFQNRSFFSFHGMFVLDHDSQVLGPGFIYMFIDGLFPIWLAEVA